MTRMYRVTARRGRGECQEVRAPRTCPALRMRQEPAPQGRSFSAPSSPAPPEGGGARKETGGRAGLRRGRGRGNLLRAPALLKGAAPSGGDDIWVGLCSLQPSNVTDGKLRFRGGGDVREVTELGHGRNWSSGLADQGSLC